ncbi:hypothetical protein OUZ56_009900 [Daphnia magna]|uniref:Uncharacterized protein n=1 Tax=Daphnia magna TaxID=35525 RepID=A0ABR0AH70_9CRUS|nr:hypothetical protein OUZ56_009900 [Daphnia magna]
MKTQHSLHLSTETDPFRLSVKNGSSKWWGTELFSITLRTAYSDSFPFNNHETNFTLEQKYRNPTRLTGATTNN